MPKDLAPLLRNIAIFAALAVAVPFFLMMKGGAFRSENIAVVFVIAAILASVAIGIFIAIDRTREATLPNPLHPDNKASEPPSV